MSEFIQDPNPASDGSDISAEVAGDVRATVRSDWSPVRTERLLLRTKKTMVRRDRVYSAMVALSAAAAVLLVAVRVGLLLAPTPVSQRSTAANEILSNTSQQSAAGQKVIRFGDGSVAELASAAAEIDVERVSPDAIDVNLHRGRSNFRVTPDRARVFTVRAGDVMVTVLGTEFTVEKRGERTWVRVTRGKVSVDWPGGNRLLLPGDEGQFPPDEPKQLADLPTDPATPTQRLGANVPKSNVQERPAVEEYRDRAAQQDFDKAYQLMQATPKVVGSDVSELMLAADVARLSGHPAEAVPYLRRVLGEHASDSRAPLAAFTLGRMYLGQLGSPGEAATAFAKVRSLSPGGPLAEDALSREVEARARAGEKASAQSLARQYLELYPNGRRTAVVRAQAGLDSTGAQ